MTNTLIFKFFIYKIQFNHVEYTDSRIQSLLLLNNVEHNGITVLSIAFRIATWSYSNKKIRAKCTI